MVFFPRLMYFGLPILIFISLFHVSENYPGISRFAQTMQATYQNKWLYDMTIFYCLLFLFQSTVKYFLMGIPYELHERLMRNYQANKNKKIAKIAKYEPYFGLIAWFAIILFCYLCFSYYFGRAANTSGELPLWKGSVFVNFIFHYVISVVGYSGLMATVIILFEIRRGLKQ